MPKIPPTPSTRSGSPLPSSSSADLVRPRYWSAPPWHDTLGPEVGAVATLAGFAPDPEQQLLLDAAFAIDKFGKSVAFEVVVVAPRQNLKTGFFKQVALGMLFVRDERLVPWTAHEFTTAQEAANDIEALIGGSDVLRKRVKLTNRGDVAKHGVLPEVKLKSGARLIFKTRTAGGGRGLSGRKVILDEGYALQDGQVGALMPIMLAQPDPQLYIGSSACRPESAYLWSIVERGRQSSAEQAAGGDGERRMVFAEWTTPPPAEACEQGDQCMHLVGTPGCGCDKPDLIRTAHSAVARGRILLQSLLDARNMPAGEFAREIMGWHDPIITGDEPALDVESWRATTDPDSSVEELVAFGVAVSIDRSWSCIGAAGIRPDGQPHIESVEHRRGVEWLVGRCIELDGTNPAATFVVDGSGPANRLIEPLQQAGLTVIVATTKDLGQSAAWLVDKVAERAIFHGPQPELDAAATGAKRRNIGDGMFAFGRRASSVDICPLEAVTLAGHVLQSVIPLDDVTVMFV